MPEPEEPGREEGVGAMLGVPPTTLTSHQALMPPTVPYAIPEASRARLRQHSPSASLPWGPAMPAVDPGAGAQLRRPQQTVGRAWEGRGLAHRGHEC